MREMPEDILRTARDLVGDYLDLSDSRNAQLANLVARAILAERQKWSAELQAITDPKWQPIETAPHETNVLLAWEDNTLPGGWKMEAGMASWGWRRYGVSNMSMHGQATRWMPLPAPPKGGDA